MYRLEWSEWLLVGVFLFTLPLVNPYIRGDGNEYYAYIRSLVIDGDLHFENEYWHGDPAFVGAIGRELSLTSTGYMRNPAAVGASLLWAPFFLTAHGVVWILSRLGVGIPADGYSTPYRWLCALGTTVYAYIGLLIAFRLAKRITTPLIALLATIGIWFGSSLPVYMYFLPFHVHALSSFAVALFIWYWLRTREATNRINWAVWGAFGGLMIDVYYLNAVLLVIPLMEYGRKWLMKEERQSVGPGKLMAQGLVFGLGLIVTMLPNFVIKGIIHGSPLSTGYTMGWFFLSSPRLVEVGFSAEHGMFLWTPLLLGAVVGLALLWVHDRWLAGNLLLAFGAFYYLVAAFLNWHGQSSFGSRFFVSFTPVFVLGLAVFLEKGEGFLSRVLQGKTSDNSKLSMTHRSFPVLVLLLGILILWNIGFIFQWGAKLVSNRGPVDFRVVARNQVTVVPQRMGSFMVRYLTSREQVTREVEQEDLKDFKTYHLRR